MAETRIAPSATTMWMHQAITPKLGSEDSRRKSRFARNLLTGLVLVAASASACSSEQSGNIWMQVVNRTNQAIFITYENPAHRTDLGQLDASSTLVVESLFDELGPMCTGPLVARRADGEEVARLEEACPHDDWVIE